MGEKEKGGCLRCLAFFFYIFLDKFCHFSRKGKQIKLLLFMCKFNQYFLFITKNNI